MVYYIVVGIIMAVSFVGMIICAKKQHVNPLAKPMAIVLLVVVVICTALILKHNMGGGDMEARIANEMKYAKASTYILGKTLAKLKPGAKILLIVNKEQEGSQSTQKILIEGLKEGLGTSAKSILIKSPQYKKLEGGPEGAEGPDGMMMPMMEMLTSETFNKMLAQNKSCNLVISLIGLPMDMGGLKLWSQFEEDPKTTPKLAILNGDITMLYPAIKSGLIPVAIAPNPDAKYTEDAAPTDKQKAFDVRYILVTTKNVDKIAKKYGEKVFFKKRK